MITGEIIEKKVLAPQIKQFDLYAPDIAPKCQAGHFIILRLSDLGERIPLTINDWNRKKGSIRIIAQEVGKTTKELGKLKKGAKILNLLGPLGSPSHIDLFGKVVCVGGGVGTAEVYPIAKALRQKGNAIISILGARNKELIILEEELKKLSSKLLITTDDGSYGRKGVVTDVLKEVLQTQKIDRIIAIGPLVMMKFVSLLTKGYNVPTTVSLNPIMVDGTGMCGGCRVTVGGEVKFACVDGPEFDGHQVDFEELMLRNARFVKEEKESLCKIS